MLSLKIWPVVFSVLISTFSHKNIFLEAPFTLDLKNRRIKPLIGGYIGCFEANVCLSHESCENDFLFGKCVADDSILYVPAFSFEEKRFLIHTKNDFQQFGLNWIDPYFQCVLRSLILKLKFEIADINVSEFCGAIPDNLVGTVPNESEPVNDLTGIYPDPDSEEVEYIVEFDDSGLRNKPIAKRLADFNLNSEDEIGEKDRIAYEIAIEGERENKKPAKINSIIRKLYQHNSNPPMIDEEYDYNVIPTKNDDDDDLFSVLNQKMHRIENDIDFAVPLNKQLERKKISPVKRFNSEKVVKVGSAEFERITRNQVWLRFNKSIDYIEADTFLKNLSSDLHIKPPIALFQLDKTGRVLQFLVPFESGLNARNVTSALVSNSLWMGLNDIQDIGIGIMMLSDSAKQLTKEPKIGHPIEDGRTIDWEDSSSTSPSSYILPSNQLSRASFVTIIVACSLALLAAFLLLIQYAIRSGRFAIFGGARKSSSGSNGETTGPILGSSLAISDVEKHQSVDSTNCLLPPYRDSYIINRPQEAEPAKEVFRQALLSNKGSEASAESMADADPVCRNVHLSSNSSWNEEPVQMQIDVTTGHLILSYMEAHLQNRDRLDADWEAISAYESEDAIPCEAAVRPENAWKNRDDCPLPYEQTRVLLSNRGNDYINASLIFDHDPRTPSYVAAETPLPGTVVEFWQMIWEQFAVVIVCLEPESALTEASDDPFQVLQSQGNDVTSQARYWPSEGSMVFGRFEVRLVSEHSQCNDYITRSFYLKELDSGETRTLTQFHFLTWSGDVPKCGDVKALLDFRRKVNKSFRMKKNPVVVHCIDGSGKTGVYLLLDLVLNRISKGVKELDVAASLEHLRDQRQGMIKHKVQFELVLAAIADEVNSMLNSAMPP